MKNNENQRKTLNIEVKSNEKDYKRIHPATKAKAATSASIMDQWIMGQV